MRTDLLEKKLESLRKCVQRIENKRPFTERQLATDFDLQDIVSLNIERAVQACVDVSAHILSERNAPSPSTMAEGFVRLANLKVLPKRVAKRMVKAVGFRNILVHEYEKMDWGIVFQIVTKHLNDFRDFTAAVLRANSARPQRAAKKRKSR